MEDGDSFTEEMIYSSEKAGLHFASCVCVCVCLFNEIIKGAITGEKEVLRKVGRKNNGLHVGSKQKSPLSMIHMLLLENISS